MKAIKPTKRKFEGASLTPLSVTRQLGVEVYDGQNLSEVRRLVRKYGTWLWLGKYKIKAASVIVLASRNPNFLETCAIRDLHKLPAAYLYYSKSGAWLVTPNKAGTSKAFIEGSELPVGTTFDAYPLKRIKGFVDRVYRPVGNALVNVRLADGEVESGEMCI